MSEEQTKHGVLSIPQDDRPALSPLAPKQIGSVTNVDKMDTIDRQKLEPIVKLQLLAAEKKASTGRDPRGGGFVFVARPRIVLQLLLDAHVGPFSSEIKLDRPMKIGKTGADVVAVWEGVPIVVRSSVVDDNLYCVEVERLPESAGIDRVRAGQLRMAAHNNQLESLRD